VVYADNKKPFATTLAYNLLSMSSLAAFIKFVHATAY